MCAFSKFFSFTRTSDKVIIEHVRDNTDRPNTKKGAAYLYLQVLSQTLAYSLFSKDDLYLSFFKGCNSYFKQCK